MKSLILLAILIVSAKASAMTCIPLTGSEEFTRLSSTQVSVKDGYNETFLVTVDKCPSLQMGDPIVVDVLGDQLCSSDSLRVGDEICPIESIVKQ